MSPTRRSWMARVVLAAMGLGLVALTVGGIARLTVSTDYSAFLPEDGQAARDLRDVADSFGGDPIVVLLESDDANGLLAGERLAGLLALEGRLSGLRNVAVAYGPATTLNQTAIQVQNLLATISGRRDGLKEADRADDLARFERRYGALLVQGMPAGLPTLRNDDFVRTVVYDAAGEPRARWRQFVPDAHAVAILVRPRSGLDQAGLKNLVDDVRGVVKDDTTVKPDRTTITGVPVLSANLADQVRSELPLVGGAAVALVAGALILSRWRRNTLQRLVPLVPMLAAVAATLAWFGWRGTPLSLGAVLFLPLMLGIGSYYPVYLAQRGHRRTVVAVAAAAAAAFACLLLSPVQFVQDLGLAMVIGIGVTTGLSTLLYRGGGENPAPTREATALATRRISVTAVAGFAALLGAPAVLGWLALGSVSVETSPETLLSGARGYDDAVTVQDRLGFAGELDVVLEGDDVLSPEALAWLRSSEEEILRTHGDTIQSVVSPGQLLGFLGDHPSQSQIDAAMRLLPAYVTGAAVTVSQDRAVIALGADLDDLATQQETIASLRSMTASPPDGFDVRIAGIPVLAAEGYDVLVRDRHWSNLAGIAAAGLVLAACLRRRRDAARAVSAALLATGWGLLAATLLGVALNPITIALGSLTAAVGCEFAVMLSEARRSGDRSLARSVIVAAAVSAAGYSALSVSHLDLLRQFSATLVAAVGLALVAGYAVSLTVPRSTRGTSQTTSRPQLAGVR
ncbi:MULTISPECIES: MMPL family transporter [unclassified Nocardioides]|uniref:MMPL family transporter n=1 Tax=unclassified Nocardioides TaxID=2615069 RepID=UPI000702BD9D|nr:MULTISPECIES: MMPL family transporter [unclassified Nocardioides]KRC46457.1 hypothetical protein ASE19_21785 [Nocardioides sp. Root79]KRC69801.1 hypothetical protein ASE20_14635 [Nocardioides sp. Root240]